MIEKKRILASLGVHRVVDAMGLVLKSMIVLAIDVAVVFSRGGRERGGRGEGGELVF